MDNYNGAFSGTIGESFQDDESLTETLSAGEVEGMDETEDLMMDGEDPMEDVENPMDEMENPDLDATDASLGLEDLMDGDAAEGLTGITSVGAVALAAVKFKRVLDDGGDVDEQDIVNVATNFDYGSSAHSATHASSGNVAGATPTPV